MQAYSDVTREDDPYALPDVEVFEVWDITSCPLCQENTTLGQHTMDSHNGWYWWTCFPGCLPDSEPIGPFDTEDAALADAQNAEGY